MAVINPPTMQTGTMLVRFVNLVNISARAPVSARRDPEDTGGTPPPTEGWIYPRGVPAADEV
jgi:hypothetical protein